MQAQTLSEAIVQTTAEYTTIPDLDVLLQTRDHTRIHIIIEAALQVGEAFREEVNLLQAIQHLPASTDPILTEVLKAIQYLQGVA